jgi:hypothetical protein
MESTAVPRSFDERRHTAWAASMGSAVEARSLGTGHPSHQGMQREAGAAMAGPGSPVSQRRAASNCECGRSDGECDRKAGCGSSCGGQCGRQSCGSTSEKQGIARKHESHRMAKASWAAARSPNASSGFWRSAMLREALREFDAANMRPEDFEADEPSGGGAGGILAEYTGPRDREENDIILEDFMIGDCQCREHSWWTANGDGTFTCCDLFMCWGKRPPCPEPSIYCRPCPWWEAMPPCPKRQEKLEEAMRREYDRHKKPGESSSKPPNGWCFEGHSPEHHPGAHSCFRQTRRTAGPGQQCCYRKDGSLITEGAGAGTPDKIAVAHGLYWTGDCIYALGRVLAHLDHDVWYYDFLMDMTDDDREWTALMYAKEFPPSGSSAEIKAKDEFRDQQFREMFGR